MMQEKVLNTLVLKPGDRDVSRGAEFVEKTFDRYGVRSYAVLVDGTSVAEDLPVLPGRTLCGLYSLELETAGKTPGGLPVALLSLDGPMPSCDGWLVMSHRRAAAAGLNHALLRTGNERMIVTRLYGGQVTPVDAYMDLLSGETETVVQIHHYFDRKYRIHFPIDVRFVICDCEGSVRLASQRIIPPGGLAVIDTRELDLGDFSGFLRLELEVENLQTHVQPFIHFWADYISEEGVTRNHQSGWDPWAPGTVFARGYYPVGPDLDVTLSFFNDGEHECHPEILLHFNRNGEEIAVERAAEPVPAGRMSYQNISRLFRDASLEGAASAFYLVRCDTPLHRPNYYVAPRGTRRFINSSHQTGSDACHWAVPKDAYQAAYLRRLERHDIDPWVIAFPVLQERFRIDTYLGLLSSTFCKIQDFTFLVRDETGRLVYSRDERLDGTSPAFMNINDWLRRRGIEIESGVFGLAPRRGLHEVPKRAISLLGFRHRDYRWLSTAPASGFEDPNLPFYVDPPLPLQQQYEFCPVLTTDRFGPGMVSEEYDTLYLVTNCSCHRSYSRTCSYRLELLDAAGRMHCTERRIPPQGCDAFWLSEILEGAPEDFGGPYCTVWQKCSDTLLISYHFLYRKRDHAMSCDDTFAGTLLAEPLVWDVTGDGEFAQPVLRKKNVIRTVR